MQPLTSPAAMSDVSGEYTPALKPTAMGRDMVDAEIEGLDQLREADVVCTSLSLQVLPVFTITRASSNASDASASTPAASVSSSR